MHPLCSRRPFLLTTALVFAVAPIMLGLLPDSASAASTPATGRYEESTSAITLTTGWKITASTRDSGGGSATLTTPGSASFTFSGTGIRWVTRTTDHSGIAKVYLDNVAVKSVDLYSATEKFQKTVFSKNWSKAGKHTIKITRTGKLNKASVGRGISLDAFVVTDSTPPPVMARPTVRASHRAIELSWPASPATDVTTYRIYRKTGSGAYVRIAQVPAAERSYTNVGLVHGTSYRYRLTALDSSGNVSSTAPSTAALMPKSASVTGRYAACPTATRTVDTAAELTDALLAAGPGSVIKLAPGTYQGYFATSAAGTSSKPIWVCGPRSAVIDPADNTRGIGLSLDGASHVIVTGMTIKNALKGVVVTGSHNTVSDLHVSDIGNEAVHLRLNASDNAVVGNLIERTGQRAATYGEGIYVGSDPKAWCAMSACEPDRSDRNLIAVNTIRSVTADAIEVKAGAADGDIRNNVINGAAMTEATSGGWIVIKGNGWLVEANRGTSAPAHGFTATYSSEDGWGRDNAFVRNDAALGNGAGYGVWVQKGIGNLVSCDNTADVSARAINVACQK